MIDEKKIEKEAKKIMDDFLKELSKIKESYIEFSIKREKFFREKSEAKCDEDFRERLFKIAKKRDGKYLVAERGKWI